MLHLVTTILASLLVALSLAAPSPARANPHVWVEAWMTFEFEDHRVKGLAFTWRFDEYYSSHTIQSYDRDGDGFLMRSGDAGAPRRHVRSAGRVRLPRARVGGRGETPGPRDRSLHGEDPGKNGSSSISPCRSRRPPIRVKVPWSSVCWIARTRWTSASPRRAF